MNGNGGGGGGGTVSAEEEMQLKALMQNINGAGQSIH